MAATSNKEAQKRRMMSYFIEATQQIIEEDGIEGISIRKVGTKAGFNSATIYNYFKDIDQLILLASMKYLNGYTIALSQHIHEHQDAYDNFISIWDFFCDSSFQHPKIFYNLFFNKHSDKLDEIVTRYYHIFPEEMKPHSALVLDMFTGQNIWDRNRKIMLPLVKYGYLTSNEMEIANEIMIHCYRGILDELCNGISISPREQKEKMLDMLHYTVQPKQYCELQNIG